MERISYEEWVQRGKDRFGELRSEWKFKCPQCGHVQAVKDFARYKARRSESVSASASCIGRWNGKLEGDGLPGCNFSIQTQPNLAALEVQYGIGHMTLMMDFAEE